MELLGRSRRPIGRILLDGGFMSQHDLGLALDEQKHTNELLGQALARMGVLDPSDINAVLSVQEHLDNLEHAVKMAAGVRQMLGALLVQSGHITREQLDHALAEQKKTGQKLGEVLVRLGLITERQLDSLLEFQRNQGAAKPSPNPLRLGEILVATGAITRDQLDDALRKQASSRKKIGEVLIEEGYAGPHHVKRGIRIQQMLQNAALIAVLSLSALSLSACGSGGSAGTDASPVEASGGSNTVMTTVPAAQAGIAEQVNSDYFLITGDDYGLLHPDFFYSTNNNVFWSIQADLAKGIYDPDFQCVMRIDIPKSANGDLPDLNKTFSLEDNPQYEKFPGSFLVFNGRKSANKKVEQGTISFTPDSTASGSVSGAFDVVLTDYDSPAVPAPRYHLTGNFHFKIGTYGPAGPLLAAAPQ
jgi:hypothetical protein